MKSFSTHLLNIHPDPGSAIEMESTTVHKTQTPPSRDLQSRGYTLSHGNSNQYDQHLDKGNYGNVIGAHQRNSNPNTEARGRSDDKPEN